MSMELKACREALKSGNKPAADELLCIKEFSMEQVKACLLYTSPSPRDA